MRNKSDGDLVGQAGSGCREAVAELFTRHYPHAVRYANRLQGDGHAAEDLAADAFLKTLEAIEAGARPRTFRHYLITAVRNGWVSRHRRHGRVIPMASPGSHFGESSESTRLHAHIIDVGEQVVNRDALTIALRQLNPRQQLVLWRTAVEGHTLVEIAEELGLSTNAASALSYRARNALIKALDGTTVSQSAA